MMTSDEVKKILLQRGRGDRTMIPVNAKSSTELFYYLKRLQKR